MVLVDIEVPSLSRKYHFMLDEDIDVELLITEIVTIIEQREQCKLDGRRENIVLYLRSSGVMLAKNECLKIQKVKNGDVLIMV